MSAFTAAEIAYLTGERRLARIATVGSDGMPHVVPTGFSYDPDGDVIEVSGIEFQRTKKYRDASRTRMAALVVDDVLPPWRPRGIEVRARVSAVTEPEPRLLLHPVRVISWGLESAEIGERHARDVEPSSGPVPGQ